ncbi:hypothetical protein GA0070609_1542 [Micromonospora echinaurantiaca]|uniref:Tetratricopeptide repeat-containing protein n=1 Tax=Micromonospora echinaurantiaca TaxID=47857 RepID=A0A1C5HFY5_9ACTN|nr:hypothetical protein [Micromonospora echinaurantiaca]SCG44843.1 hypothetical protein GA0070609_1542 [Micromonospora echinaurantiaca]
MTAIDGAPGQRGRTPSTRQQVLVENGFGYGVIGADLHVFGDGRPVYLLSEAGRRPGLTLAVDDQGLPAQPSHLLNARHAVVDFTGRHGEVGDLTAWRDGGGGRAVRWLHAPGGQGKTRLASHLAESAARDGWKVIVAEHTPARVVDVNEPASHDLRVGAARGLLMVVDYADRWPLTHLTWLFSNKVFDQDVPVRVLLLARNEHIWAALRHALTQAGWSPEGCTSQALGALPRARDARGSMFVAARDCFARRYGLPDAAAIGVPDWLDRDEFGLTLAVHMAALVAVDRHARSAAQPEAPREGMTALTAYLLERENLHWHALHSSGDMLTGGRTTFTTTPTQLRRAVFTAALTGPLGYREARAALDRVGVGDADQVLGDHTFCYPPADPRTVLEPLYPDRLAEDFLALCLPGHDLPGHESDAWTHGVPELLLAPSAGDNHLPPYAARAFTFLTAASERWPHLIATLEGLERLLPEDPHDAAGDLTVAAADLADRLARHRLPTVTDPAERAELHDVLGRWLDRANREDEAADALREAVRLYRSVAATDPRSVEPKLAWAALHLAQVLVGLNLVPEPGAFRHLSVGGDALRPGPARRDEALAAFREAVEILRRLARDNPAEHEKDLAGALSVVGVFGPHLGAAEESRAFARECVEIVSRLARDDPDEYADAVPLMLANLAGNLVTSEPEQAAALAAEAVEGARRLVGDHPADPEQQETRRFALHFTLVVQAGVLLRLGRAEPALAVLDEAVRIAPGQREDDPDGSDAWAETVSLTLGLLWVQGSEDDAGAGLEGAMQVLRRQARANPTAHRLALFHAFLVLDYMLRQLERWELVLAGQRDVIDFLKAADDALRYDVIGVLAANGAVLVMLGRWDEALDVIGEIAEELRREGTAGGWEHGLGGALVAVATNGAGVTPGESPDDSGYGQVAQDETVATLHRIAAAYRRRAGGDPHDEHGLAVTLKLLAEALWILDRPGESLATGREAIAVRRRLARDGSPEHHDHLALALQRQVRRLERVGQHREAVVAAAEAVDLYEQLVRVDAAAHEPALAATLHLLAVNLWWSRPAEALEPARRAVEIVERLARAEPAVHGQNLANALDVLAGILRDLGWEERARAAASQAAEVRDRLAVRG